MGIGEDEQTEFYLKSSGQRYLDAKEGVTIFETILCQEQTQHLVIVGQPSRVHCFLGLTERPLESLSPEDSTPERASKQKGRVPEMRGLSVAECLERDLKEQVSRLLKIARESLDMESNLADYGFDSISLTEFARILSNHYDFEVTPALFFGHSTLEKLKTYFLKEHSKNIEEFYQETKQSQEVALRFSAPHRPKLTGLKRVRRSLAYRSSEGDLCEPIAIIGMSGRFPQARSVEEMWSILSEGKNAVEEIPRWPRVMIGPKFVENNRAK